MTHSEVVKENFQSTMRESMINSGSNGRYISFLDTVGSCSMLPREDGGVVDNKLKVGL